MNENDQIMIQDFTKRFVNHRNIGLAPQTLSESPLHHAECGFDVRPLVIVLHKFGAPELKVMDHPCPSLATLAAGNCAEGGFMCEAFYSQPPSVFSPSPYLRQFRIFLKGFDSQFRRAAKKSARHGTLAVAEERCCA